MFENGSNRFLVSASEIYDGLEFNTDSLFNNPAPEPWVAFLIGILFTGCSVVMWVLRVLTLKAEMQEQKIPFKGSSMVRALLSATIDSSSSPYVIVSYSAASFILLGSFQLNYEKTLVVMLVFYFVTSSAEILRILLTFKSTDSLANIRLSCNILRAQFRNMNQEELKPTNLYEDLGRGMSTVVMTFLTQCLLISFVFVDTYENATTSCRDGTSGCPKVGTFGSWGFYVIGIYMACVFLLGPKTNYGLSEQNPAFWIQLLILARESPNITWYDPIKHVHHERRLSLKDPKVWIRFCMTFLINGVGFHILVHALPIQVASQSSFTGVVFRAVGMMYLVDLDDTTGYTLTIMKDSTEKNEDVQVPSDKQSNVESSSEQPAPKIESSSDLELSAEAQRIIDEARAKLELLAMTKGRIRNPKTALRMDSSGCIEKVELDNNTESESDEDGSNKNKTPAPAGSDEVNDDDDSSKANKRLAPAELEEIYDECGEPGIEVLDETGMIEV